MLPFYYEELHQFSLELINASCRADKEAVKNSYKDIFDLCQYYKGTEEDHPFQWETLADFTDEIEKAIDYYRIGLNLAINQNLKEYEASISIGLGKLLKDSNELVEASDLFKKAKIICEELGGQEFIESLKDLI